MAIYPVDQNNNKTGAVIETADFDLNLIPGFAEAVRRYVQYIFNDMEADGVDGDEWELHVKAKFTRGVPGFRTDLSVKRPKLTCESWKSKPVGWVRENGTIRIEKNPDQGNLFEVPTVSAAE